MSQNADDLDVVARGAGFLLLAAPHEVLQVVRAPAAVIASAADDAEADALPGTERPARDAGPLGPASDAAPRPAAVCFKNRLRLTPLSFRACPRSQG